VAAFDSGLGTVHLLAAALRGRDLPRLGQGPLAAAGVRATTALPAPLRRRAYARAGAGEAVPPEDLADVDLEAVAGFVAGQYPRRRYPAVLVGAANGGLTHAAAACQVPFLPATVLVPVRWADNRPDRPDRALRWGSRAAGALLDANPGVELHHMHDGNQDALMVSQMAYFRCKWATLPASYRTFLDGGLQPGGTVVLVRGRTRWPVTRVGDRHVFQNGAYGGLEPGDYARAPHAPVPDETAPEAEWGTGPAFEQAVRDWALATGHPVVELGADDPQDLGLRVATMLLARRREAGVERPRLLVDQFISSQPWHALRTGAVPLWTVFPVRRCLEAAERWVATNGPFARVDVALFNHGARSRGLAPVTRWQGLATAGDRPGVLLGQRASRFPADFAALARTTPAFRRLPDGPPWAALPVSALADV
jgi:hypothetical protein